MSRIFKDIILVQKTGSTGANNITEMVGVVDVSALGVKYRPVNPCAAGTIYIYGCKHFFAQNKYHLFLKNSFLVDA